MINWREQLDKFFEKKKQNEHQNEEIVREVDKQCAVIKEDLYETIVVQAYSELKEAFKKHNVPISIDVSKRSATISVPSLLACYGDDHLQYTIKTKSSEKGDCSIKSFYRYLHRNDNMVTLSGEISTADYKTITKDMVIKDFMAGWEDREKHGKQGTTQVDLLKLY